MLSIFLPFFTFYAVRPSTMCHPKPLLDPPPPPRGLRPTVSWGVVGVHNRGVPPPPPQALALTLYLTLIKTEYWDQAGGGGNINHDW